MAYTVFYDMLGLVMVRIENTLGAENEMIFVAQSGRRFRFWHENDCCENVQIEEIVGDLNDLIGTPILMAEEVSNEDAPVYNGSESYTWTFYKFATVKGNVTVRWLGESSGYYSESVSYEEMAPESFFEEEIAPETHRNSQPINPFEEA